MFNTLYEILYESTKFTLDTYRDITNFTDVNMGNKFKLHEIVQLAIPPHENVYPIYRKYKPGTKVLILGRVINQSGQHSFIVNPIDTNEIYRVYGYYLLPKDVELAEPVKRLKKRLTGDINCGNCGHSFSLAIPNGLHRDHCPYCLYSVHIDNKPGDRNAWCGTGTHNNWIPSKLKPVGTTELNNVYSIAYTCVKCGANKINKVAADDNKSLLSKLPHVSIKRVSGKPVFV